MLQRSTVSRRRTARLEVQRSDAMAMDNLDACSIVRFSLLVSTPSSFPRIPQFQSDASSAELVLPFLPTKSQCRTEVQRPNFPVVSKGQPPRFCTSAHFPASKQQNSFQVNCSRHIRNVSIPRDGTWATCFIAVSRDFCSLSWWISFVSML